MGSFFFLCVTVCVFTRSVKCGLDLSGQIQRLQDQIKSLIEETKEAKEKQKRAAGKGTGSGNLDPKGKETSQTVDEGLAFLDQAGKTMNEAMKKAEESGVRNDTESTEDEIVEVHHPDVLVLTDTNFDGIVDKNGTNLLALFYSSEKDGFQNITKRLGEAAAVLKTNEPAVLVGKVDVAKQAELFFRFISRDPDMEFPFFRVFRQGIVDEYDGAKNTSSDIISYMKEIVHPDYKPPSSVVILTKENFTTFIAENDITLVVFYTPSCEGWVELSEELYKAAHELSPKNLDSTIKIAKIDASIETEIAKEYKVEEYPTKKLFLNGEAKKYTGPADNEGMVTHLFRFTREPPPMYNNLDEVHRLIKLNLDIVTLGVFTNDEDPLFHVFVEANERMLYKSVLGYTFNKEVKEFFHVEESGIVIIHPEYLLSPFEERFQIYRNTSGNVSSVLQFYKEHSTPLVGHLHSEADARFYRTPLLVVYYFVDFEPEYRNMTEFWRKKILNVAHRYPDIQFAIANEESYSKKLEDLGLGETSEDISVGLYDEQNRRYALSGENFGEEALVKFIEQFKAGKLEPVVKSQTPAAKAKRGSVQVVVGTTFEKIVLDETKEVFVFFYDTQCVVSKAIAPNVVKLAAHFKDEPNIIIAKMDATENDVPDPFVLPGYPTSYYANPGKKKNPYLHVGKNDLQGLIKFVNDKSDLLKKRKTIFDGIEGSENIRDEL